MLKKLIRVIKIIKRDCWEIFNKTSPYYVHWFFKSNHIKKYKKKAVAIDIGAHSGRFAWSLKKTKRFSKIFIFEPQLKLINHIKIYFDNKYIINKALSNFTGEKKLKIPFSTNKLLTTRASLDEPINDSKIQESNYQEISVSVSTLDIELSNLAKNEHDISLIKIDAEGEEINILEGAQKTIKKYKPDILIELEYGRYKNKVNKSIKFLEDHNYALIFNNQTYFKFDEIKNLIINNYLISSDFLFSVTNE